MNVYIANGLLWLTVISLTNNVSNVSLHKQQRSMKTFCLSKQLDTLYQRYPEGQHRPVVGITANVEGDDYTLRQVYCQQIVAAGGVPLIIPAVADAGVICSTLDSIDALLLTGGADLNPLWTNEEPAPTLGHINAARDLPELLITRLAYNRCVPIMGICRGLQMLTVAMGGTVLQDMGPKEGRLKHSQDADKSEPTHSVTLLPDTLLRSLFNNDEHIYVNTFHHQAVGTPGPKLKVSALAPDGIIEAVESNEHKALLGVQWHPEWLKADGQPLFRWLINEAKLYAEAKAFHDAHIVLDSHCDTPMFFPQGIDFGTRDPHLLVDLHKMDDGRQAAVTMVAYLEQPKEGKTFAEIAPFPVEGPKAYADLIFNKINDIVSAHPNRLALATTPQQLLQNKRAGKHTIMLGIENGQAIEDNLDNIDHFAQRGIVYITLCHNGDNQICDSARGNHTWGGVSPFGRQVIERMNRLGIMVDLSHGGEQSFYDALELSSKPIVCSHSSCRALCDHPRNLTDDQMRQLALKGGVMQVTAYHGFLSLNDDASIATFMQHLNHAVEVMGIDHVGIGTDFDGDGGVPGLADSSDLMNLTRHLLMQGYTTTDIEKLWGGNWLRVMKEVQGRGKREEGKVKSEK